jgi:two-component system NtrC family sensor kinase
MNQNLQSILDFFQQSENLSEDEKTVLIKAVKEADKALIISEFKLERTEKVKRTTAILLEETIEELEQKRKAIEKTNQALSQSLIDLKSTQSQLIQAEKMASLGELTAGIAHEIQNPLNFVNNFSEVSIELLEELIEEIKNGNVQEINDIANDVIENLKKINHHGKRADGIVKGMLQHSRKSKGEKEPTDINNLVDEYLRLAYHGLRAKDKSFNATINTKYDTSIKKINIIPQDIGRVVLNLITNAFYVINEKKATITDPDTFKPTVSVKTEKINEIVTVSIKDNGNGIPKEILDKIFQPFFTTKPTGHGTGLGLSLSYDIVKAHGGELRVFTEVKKGTKFVISLPINH